MTRILLLVLALIVYGSLYPWEYRPGPANQTALQVVLHSWPAHIGRSDIADISVNVLLYIPVGMFAFFALDRFGCRRLRWLLPGLIGLVVSSSIEMLQVFDRTRDPSLLDVFDNTIGSLAGMLAGLILRNAISGSTLLVLYWLGFQLTSLFGLIAGRSGPRLSLIVCAGWLVMLYMLAAPEPSGRLRICWPLAWIVFLLASGLAPFHLQRQPAPFHWLPFHAMFQAEWIVGLPIFLEKSFYYGAAIWLFRRAGVNFVRATAVVASILAAVEVLQRYLPGRTPEITDPLLAIILGCMLWLIEQDRASPKPSAILQVPT